MTIATISPTTHRGFLLNKLVRNRPMLHAMDLGGHVFAHLSTGREKLSDDADKILQELDEVLEAETEEETFEEIADVMDAIALTERGVGERDGGFTQKYYLDDVEIIERLAFIQRVVDIPAIPEALINSFFRKLLGDIDNYLVMQWGVSDMNQNLIVVRAAKEAKSGPLEGWFAKAIFLPINEDPSTQKWMTYFADKFEEIQNFTLYNPAMALTPDHIYRHSYNLRHPQG